MLVAVMSDSHDHWMNLAKAVDIANTKHCQVLLFAGDLMSPGIGVRTLLSFEGRLHFICGNNDGEAVMLTMKLCESENGTMHRAGFYEGEIDKRKICMQHYPRPGQLIALAQQHDLVVYGHDHLYHEERIGDTILLNPGAIVGNKEQASFAIYDTQAHTIERILL